MPLSRVAAGQGHERVRGPSPRAIPLWEWASGDPGHVSVVAGGLRLTAADLLAADASAGGPAGVAVEAFAASRAGGPATATRLAAFPGTVGLRPGPTAFATAAWSPTARNLLAGLLHARHTVHLPDGGGDPFSALAGCDGDVVVAHDAGDRLLADVAAHCRRVSHARVLVLGLPREPAALRAAFRAAAGHDPLTFLGATAAGVVSLDPAPGTGLGGFWDRDPDEPAVTTAAGAVVTAGELAARAAAVAAWLHERLAPGDAFAVRSDDETEVLVACLAALRSGLAFVPLSPAATDDTVAHLARATRARLVVGGPAGDLPVVPFSGPAAARGDAPWLAGRLLGYTSGTTGRPKAVLHRADRATPELAAARDVAFAGRLGIGAGGAHLVCGRLHQLPALHFATLALHAGQELVLLGGWNPARATRVLADRPVSSAFLVPTMLAALLALPERLRAAADTSALTSVVHSTAACPVPLKQRVTEWLGPVLYDFYAPTEALGTYATPEESAAAPGTVGLPLPGVEVRVLDDDGAPLPPGEPGLVHLTDPGFRYDDASAPHRRTPGFVSVGDVGYLDGEGRLFLVGRRTDYVSVGGEKFHPSEVERVLETLDGVAECAVAGEGTGALGQLPVAFVRLADGADAAATVAALTAALRTRLPAHQVPRRIEVVAALPRDELGKLRRRELPVRAS